MNRLFACMLSSLAAAQSYVTVPPAADARDGTGVGWVPGFERPGRVQFLIGESLLTGAVGRELRAMTFRRDGFEPARSAGQADVTVSLSTRPTLDPLDVSTRFVANRGAPTIVFQGRLALPASPRLAQRDAAGWNTPNAVTITFAQPWSYTGGTLCVEVFGEPVAGATSPAWSIDLEVEATTGQRVVLGTGCGAIAARSVPQATVDVRQLRAGATARFTCAGEVGATGLFLISATTLPQPIDLAAYGAPGCDLWVLPDVVLTAALGPSLPGLPGAARLDLPLPAQPGFVGASFAAQWLRLGTSGIETSNALRLGVSGQLAQQPASVVQANFAAGQDRDHGLVQVGAVPVVRLHW